MQHDHCISCGFNPSLIEPSQLDPAKVYLTQVPIINLAQREAPWLGTATLCVPCAQQVHAGLSKIAQTREGKERIAETIKNFIWEQGTTFQTYPTYNDIAQYLNSMGLLTTRGAQWNGNTIFQWMRNNGIIREEVVAVAPPSLSSRTQSPAISMTPVLPHTPLMPLPIDTAPPVLFNHYTQLPSSPHTSIQGQAIPLHERQNISSQPLHHASASPPSSALDPVDPDSPAHSLPWAASDTPLPANSSPSPSDLTLAWLARDSATLQPHSPFPQLDLNSLPLSSEE